MNGYQKKEVGQRGSCAVRRGTGCFCLVFASSTQLPINGDLNYATDNSVRARRKRKIPKRKWASGAIRRGSDSDAFERPRDSGSLECCQSAATWGLLD
ncbi:Lipase_GDSL domain-containing protein [Psidium guajava]|nr:Lipase_GDSL domain-containing protein [Psidium guajava]